MGLRAREKRRLAGRARCVGRGGVCCKAVVEGIRAGRLALGLRVGIRCWLLLIPEWWMMIRRTSLKGGGEFGGVASGMCKLSRGMQSEGLDLMGVVATWLLLGRLLRSLS